MNEKMKKTLRLAAMPAGAFAVMGTTGLAVLASEVPAEAVVVQMDGDHEDLLNQDSFYQEPAAWTLSDDAVAGVPETAEYTPVQTGGPTEQTGGPTEQTGSSDQSAQVTLDEGNYEDSGAKELQPGDVLTGDKEAALDSLTVSKTSQDGKDLTMPITDSTKEAVSAIGTAPVTADVDQDDDGLFLHVNAQLKDVNLTDTSITGIANGNTASSYYNLLDFHAQVIQVQDLMNNTLVDRVMDSRQNMVNGDYVRSLLSLLNQINTFDPKTDLKYDWDSAYNTEAFKNDEKRGGLDVIATSEDGQASFKFHINSGGHWGYEIGGTTQTPEIVGSTDDEGNQLSRPNHDANVLYGNFFVIQMKSDDNGAWYMIKDTDLENPMIYVSRDGKEALMIDVDFYGEHVLNQVIKSVIGEACEKLNVFLTHNHLDHTYNLDVIFGDDHLRNITTILWPENEPHTVRNGKDIISQFQNIKTLKDQEKFNIGDYEFQFVEIPHEHTPGGGQLMDLKNKVLYSGDSLGAQVHLGGTTFSMSQAQGWLNGAKKTIQMIDENGIEYIIGGHTPYLNTPEFAKWLETAVQEAIDQYNRNPNIGSQLIIVKDGKVLDDQEKAAVLASGANDRQELSYLSIRVNNNMRPVTPEEPADPEEPQNPGNFEEPEIPDTNEEPESPAVTQPEPGFTGEPVKMSVGSQADRQTPSDVQKPASRLANVPTRVLTHAGISLLTGLSAMAVAVLIGLRRRKR